MADTEWPVRITGIERVVDQRDKYTRVQFSIYRAGDEPLQLSFKAPADIDDAAIVPVARNYLARTLGFLAEQTASWVLNEEQFRALVPKKPNQ